MAFDYHGALRASSRLSQKNAELTALKQSLDTYQAQLRSAWSGKDSTIVLEAIDAIKVKITEAQRDINSLCRKINNGAAALKTKEDTERAEARMRSAAGGGKGSFGGGSIGGR